MFWLLEQSILNSIESFLTAAGTPSVEQQAQFELAHGSAAEAADGSRVLSIAGDVAEISIKGILTKKPSVLAMIFGDGNTTYSDIVSAIFAAEQDESIKRIVLSVDSPGGSFDGWYDAALAIKSAQKPVTAIVSNIAASGAYGLAAVADTITASNKAVVVGSIGVVTSAIVNPAEIKVRSTAAPQKNLDFDTKEGVAVATKRLDDIHDIFVGVIAGGRGVTAADVNKNYGRGSVFMAKEAMAAGMIDNIGENSNMTKTRAAKGGEKLEAETMNEGEFKAKHPALYAAAVQAGVTEERQRVTAHIILAESSGDMATAMTAIKDGAGITPVIQATHMAASMNKRDQADRIADDVAATAGDTATTATEGESTDQVAAKVEELLGFTISEGK